MSDKKSESFFTHWSSKVCLTLKVWSPYVVSFGRNKKEKLSSKLIGSHRSQSNVEGVASYRKPHVWINWTTYTYTPPPGCVARRRWPPPIAAIEPVPHHSLGKARVTHPVLLHLVLSLYRHGGRCWMNAYTVVNHRAPNISVAQDR